MLSLMLGTSMYLYVSLCIFNTFISFIACKIGGMFAGFVHGQSHADPRNPFSPYPPPKIAQSEQETA